MKPIDFVTRDVLDSAYRIHTALGPGLLESVYELTLARDLARRGFKIERQKPISYEYDGLLFPEIFRADIVVNGVVIVEIKSVAKILDVHIKQLTSYLRLADCRIGLLLNFNSAHLRDGIKRVINGYDLQPTVSSVPLWPLRETK